MSHISYELVHHPWLNSSHRMKRKLSAFVQNCSEDAARSVELSIKRPRTVLEAEFSSLSLDSREPHLYPIPDAGTKPRSWYELEPNRIVVTDLELSSDDEAETDSCNGPISIPSELLKRMGRNFIDTSKQPPSQALVLYRPLPIAGVSKFKIKYTGEDKFNHQMVTDIVCDGDKDIELEASYSDMECV